MYTKIGLGLLAAAGLTFGVVGMQTGGASPATPVCAHGGGGSSSSATGNASATGDQNGATNPSTNGNAGAEGNGTGLNNGNGSDNGNGNGSGNGNSSPTPTTTNPGSNNSSASAADTTFLDLRGHTDQTDVGDGTATVPPTQSQLTGHSRSLHRLLRIDGNVNTDH
jgi:hypothetical protein